jgi:hypothetical protein
MNSKFTNSNVAFDSHSLAYLGFIKNISKADTNKMKTIKQKTMKTNSFIRPNFLFRLVMVFIMMLAFGQVWGQKTWDGGGDGTSWSSANNWNPNSVPLATETVSISRNANTTINVDGNYTCVDLTLTLTGNDNGNRTLQLNILSGNKLTIDGAININNTSTRAFRTKTCYIDVIGSLETNSDIIMSSTSGNDNKVSSLRISGGTVDALGDIIMNAVSPRNDITFTTGTLNVSGDITGGTINSGTGIINYNSAIAQQIGSYTYYNLTTSGGSTKTLIGATTVANNLTLTSGVLQLGNNNLSLTSNATDAIQGAAFTNSNMIETDGSGYVIRNAATALPITFPVGSGGFYSPVSLTAISTTTGTISVNAVQDFTLGSNYLEKYWDVITSISGKTITATFNYDPAEIATAPTQIYVKPNAGNYQTPTGTQSLGTNSFTITGTTDIINTSGFWTVGPVPGTYFSYQTGDWNTASTWTSDPGGTTQVGSTIPGAGDVVVILSGRTVTLPTNITTANLEVNINEGGILDMSTFSFTSSFAELNGQGTLRLASTNFPAATINNFVNNGGGTTEYYNTSDFTLPLTQLTYNHLKINAPSFIATQLNNITINGNLNVTAGTFRINDNSANRRQLTINGNITVDAGAQLTVGTGQTSTLTPTTVPNGGTAPFIDYYGTQSHTIIVKGDFTNNGTVRFTNQAYPTYNAFPTNGFATVYFQGATNSNLTCNSTTDFYNLVLDKGVDQTFSLTVYSTAFSNFRLFGANTAGGYGGGANPNLQKALWIRTGTLVLQGLTIIPTLTESSAGGTPNGDYYIPSNGALVLDGSEVIVLSTADDYTEVNRAYTVTGPNNGGMGILATGGNQSFSVYGKFQVNNGYFSTRESGGLITWNVASGQIVINGGTVDVKQFRSVGGGGGLASYDQSGGTLIMRGRFQHSLDASSIIALKNINLNTARSNAGLDGTLGTFNLNEVSNVFTVSGGTIRIYDVCGDGSVAAQQKAFEVLSSTGNINVTGGTLELIPTSGTGLANSSIYSIISNAALGNLTLNRASSASVVQIVTYPITILNNLNLTSGELNANNLDITIGGDISIASGTTYIPGTNATILNGSGTQTFTVNLGAALSLYKFTIDKAAGKAVNFAGTQKNINVTDNFRLVLGTLNDNGNTINLAKDCYNSGLHIGSGKIVLNASANVQTIDGNGIFQNMELNNTNAAAAPVSLIAGTTINGVLTLSQDKLFNIATFNLKLGSSATILNAGVNRYIQTSGNSGDGGLTRVYASITPFVFPIGAPTITPARATKYTPATIGFTSAPSTYGSITVIPVGYEHPSTTSTLPQSLSYFWRIKSSEFTGVVAGSVTHSFVYDQIDVVGTETNYIPSIYDRTTYTWNNGLATDINTTSNTINDWASPANSTNFLDADYTVGDAAFGTPVKFYSIAGTVGTPALWNSSATWSHTSGGAAIGGASTAGVSFPGENSIVIVENNNYILLSANEKCASLQIADGAVVDIYTYTGSVFGMVQSFAPNSNGLFRLTTTVTTGNVPKVFSFPSNSDFSDFNNNIGTTEYYDIDGTVGALYILPANVTSYGNLMVTAKGGDNLVFPNNSLTTINGDLTCGGDNANAWIAVSWNTNIAPYNSGVYNPTVEKTIHIKGNLNINTGTFIFMPEIVPQHLIIDGNVTVGANGYIEVQPSVYGTPTGSPVANTMTIGGDFTNNSTASPNVRLLNSGYYCDLTFHGSNNATFSGSSTSTILNKVTVNKGSSQATTLTCNIGGTLTTQTDNWLSLQNGTFIYDRAGTNLTLTTTSPFTIPSTAGLTITNANNVLIANAASNTNDLFLNGKLTIMNGNVYIGPTNGTTVNNNDIEYSGGGASTIDIQGGNLVVNGQIRRNPATTNGILKYYQIGGNLVINGQNSITGNAKLEICNSGSVFNMSAGTLTIVRGGGTTYGDLYLRAASSSVTGGEIIFSQSPILGPVVDAVQNYILDANVAVNDLTITGKTAGTARNATVTMLISSLTLNGDLTLSNNRSILDMNASYDIDLTVKGGFINNGTYNHYENLTTFSGGAQTIEGSSTTGFYDLVVNPVTSLTLIRDVTVLKDLTLGSGQFLNSTFSVNVKGNLVNNANYDGNATQGGVILNGSSLQIISGTGTFGRLELTNSNGARLLNDITLQKNLKLTSGILDINQYMLTLGENSIIEGSGFNNTKMIASDGAFNNVGLRKYFGIYSGVAKVFTYPIGTSGKYTPAVITYTDNGSVGYIRINNINDNHPGVIDPTNVLDYYWEVSSFGITGLKASLVLNYLEEDIQVTGANLESNYIGAGLLIPGTSWTKILTAVDASANTIFFDYSTGINGISGEFTAGIDAALPTEVPQFTSITNGDWSDKDNWVQTAGSPYTLTGAPTGFIVTIDVDDIVTINSNYASAYRTAINGKLKVVSGTYGHNLGTVSGNGILNLETATFPAGRYTDFFDCGNNATLEYGGIAQDYAIIADLYSSVPKLHFTGSGTRTLPNKDLTICTQLLIDGATLDNSVNNKKLTIQGTMERINSGVFNSGSGAGAIVSFAGTSPQTIGGTLGDFTGSSDFNHFEINNSHGLTINANGGIEVSGNLMLTSGNIVTTSTNKLTITNTAITAVTPLGGQSTSYVNGPLLKKINQGDNFTFPIGNDNKLGNKINLSISQVVTVLWSAEYFTPNSTYTNYTAPLSYVNSEEYWKVNAPAGSQATINISWDTDSDLTPLNTVNGLADMRVTTYNAGTSKWDELSSSATGTSDAGKVYTNSSVTIPAAGSDKFSIACINIVKPKAKLTPTGPVCGTAGIPVSFTPTPTLNFTLDYTLNGVPQTQIAITSLPYTLPTPSPGTYKLTAFTFNGGSTGAVDAGSVIAYALPTVANAGPDQSLCGLSTTTLAGNTPVTGTGLWSIVSGTGGTVVTPTVTTSTFNGTNGTAYNLQWKISNGGCESTDQVGIVFPILAAQPAAFTTSSPDVCNLETGVVYRVPLDATVSYNWSYTDPTHVTIYGTSNVVTVDFDNSAVSGTLSVSASNGCGSSDARTIGVTVRPVPVVSLTSDDVDNMICTGTSVIFTANSASGPAITNYDFLIDDVSFQSNATTTYTTSALAQGNVVKVIAMSAGSCTTTSNELQWLVADGIWTGTTSTDWFEPANWSCAGVPNSSRDLIVPTGAARMPVINATGATFRNIIIQNAATLTTNGTNNIDVYGNWTNDGLFVPNAGSITFNGTSTIDGATTTTFNHIIVNATKTLIASSGSMNVSGSITNSGTFNHNNGTLVLNGTAVQTISGVSDLYNLQINNAAGITLADNTDVANNLTLTNGIITMGSGSVLAMTNASGISSPGSTSSYVNGKMSKVGTAFLFPVGNATQFKQIEIIGGSVSTTWSAEYLGDNANLAIDPSEVNMVKVSNLDRWFLGCPTSANGTVRLHWNTSSDVGDGITAPYSTLMVAMLNGSNQWTNMGNSGIGSGSDINSGTVTSGSVSFSDHFFTIGSTNLATPLPVEMLSFTGNAQADNVVLYWSTASERNNDYFEVQRSIDAVNFITIGQVYGASYSMVQLDYAYVDRNPNNGTSYYRLKQVDFDGASEIHNTIAIKWDGPVSDLDSDLINVYPNPYKTGDLLLDLYYLEPYTSINLSITDIHGKQIYSASLLVPENQKVNIVPIAVDELNKGIYLVSVQTANKLLNKKVIVN